MIFSRGTGSPATAASVWEISIEHSKNGKAAPVPSSLFAEMREEAGYQELDIVPAHAMALEGLRRKRGSRHRDPFDRMLIAQAKAEGMKLLTHDGRADDYDEPCILKA